ncbi:MAG: hypothetical protein M3346_08140 [Actinomycetota bacterium]|nr:hypothetical protein [Actinomycetota bacterium]
MSNRWLKLATAVLALGLVTISVALAFAEVNTKSGRRIDRVKIRRSDEQSSTSSTNFENVPGAKVNITVPRGEAVLLARFTAESICFSEIATPGQCHARITVNGDEAAPASGTEFVFDSNDSGTETEFSAEGRSMDRSRGPLGPGTYMVRVQGAVSDSDLEFLLDDWSLTVERIKR